MLYACHRGWEEPLTSRAAAGIREAHLSMPTKPSIAAPAAVISNSVSAIWPAISPVCKRLPRTLPVRRRVPACITWLIWGRADCSCGKQPEDDSAHHRQNHAETQNRKVDVEVGFVGIGVLGQSRDEERDRPIGDKDPQARPHHVRPKAIR